MSTDSTVAMLERLAAGPKPFVVVMKWRHENGEVETRELAQPRRRMAENFASRYRPHIGKPHIVRETGRTVTLESVEIEERH